MYLNLLHAKIHSKKNIISQKDHNNTLQENIRTKRKPQMENTQMQQTQRTHINAKSKIKKKIFKQTHPWGIVHPECDDIRGHLEVLPHSVPVLRGDHLQFVENITLFSL